MNLLVQAKQSIVIYLRNFVRQYIMAADVTPAYVQGLMQIFYNTLVSPVVAWETKRHLFLIFENLIVVYQTIEGSNEAVANFYSQLFNTI